MSCEEAFQNLLKTCLSFGGSLEGCNWRATRREEGEGDSPALFQELKKSALILQKKKCVDKSFIKVPKLHEISPALKNFWLHRCLIKQKWGANIRKRLYSEMW